MHIADYHPYRNKVFWLVFLLTFGVTVAATASVYFFISNAILRNAQQDLENIAVKTAALVPVDVHEKLRQPDDQESDDYELIVSYFRSVMAGNPKIDDIYTLRPTATPHRMTFVVSGMDTADANLDNYLDENEQKPELGEVYDTAAMKDLEYGLTGPSYDQAITYDKWGAWLSGYAPLKNDAGQAVAVLGVDYAASSLTAERADLRDTLGWVVLIMLPLCVGCGLLLGHLVQRPFRKLADGMNRILGGDLDYELSAGKGEDQLLADLFNHMRHVFADAAKRKIKEE